MRNFISYILIAITAVSMAGCLNVNVSLVEPKDPTKVTLQLRNADLVATRAVTDDNLFNEDLIVNAQCFFTATDSDEVLHATDLIQINEQQTKTLNLEIPADKISSLFGTTTKCDVYVVANYGEKITDNSIAAIKSKPITLGADATQTSFVMDGEAEVNLSGTSLSGTVDLYRAAAKIVVKAKINTSITEGGITWTQNTDAITMKYTGSIVNSKISANAGDGSVTEGRIYEHSTGVFTQDTDESTSEKYVRYQTTPFYSFPVATDNNKGEIDMVIPWKPGNGKEVEYTYQIPVNIALERNHVYIIEVNVEVLGNLDGAELNPSYTVVGWTENPITAGLSKPKYLVVEETQVVMNNVNSYSIPYSSSDAVSAVITSITKPNYSGRLESTTTLYSGSGSAKVTPTTGNTNPFSVSVADGKVIITHTLNNNNTDTEKFDYVPYTITIKVTNESGFSELITIVQYPAMYISVDLNTDYDNDNSVNGNRGYAWVNNSYSTLGNLNGYSTQNSNSNPNMITITTNSFTNNDYIIGDPRVSEIDNLDYRYWASAPSLYGTSPRTLTYYYPTNTSEDTKNVISPKFRIASSYGLTSSISMTEAKRRCASYQEDGYPAGRWRVPTAAELRYIVQLSASGYITILFNDNGNYWAADETIYVPNYNTGKVTENTRANSAYVRCVYDEWYWGSEKETSSGQETLTSFTWGDAPRN